MRLGIAGAALALVFGGLSVLGLQANAASLPVAPDNEPGRLVLVLDSSGSMKEQAAGGQRKIDAAKDALGEVVSQLPDDAEVGLRVFGAKVFSAKDAGACEDTQNVVPVGPLDRDALTQAVADYRPYGETPIGRALQEAARDLDAGSASGPRSIVLLSDGEPTCEPDPCQVAKKLSSRGIDLTINVVGLDVSGAARKALSCIARAGGGTYYDAHPIEQMRSKLAMVAYDMNDEPLPYGHGAPLRLRNEIQIGFKQVKWIRAIEFVADFGTIAGGEGGYNQDHEFFGYRQSI